MSKPKQSPKSDALNNILRAISNFNHEECRDYLELLVENNIPVTKIAEKRGVSRTALYNRYPEIFGEKGGDR